MSEKEKKPNVAMLLWEALQERLILWKTSDGQLYADYVQGGRRITLNIDSSDFELFLLGFSDKFLEMPVVSQKILSEVRMAFKSACHHSGVVRELHIRIASHEGKVYYDLGLEDNSAVEIDDEGWRIVANPPVKFYRPKGMLPQVIPTGGGSIDMLRKFTNFEKDEEFSLYVGWLLGAFNVVREYPILIFNGGQGTAKSVTTLLSKLILDPHNYKSFSEPKDIRDLVAYARNSFVISMDNVSTLPHWLSDSMCRLTHGTAALGGRELYKDHDMAAFAAARPIIMNGIPEFVERNDLADRVIQIHLKPIPPEKRKTGSEIQRQFDSELPAIFGALLDLVVAALRKENVNEKKMPLPRMADWASFAGYALGFDNILTIYQNNKDEAESNIAENNVLAAALINLLLDKKEWEGDLQLLQKDLFGYKPIGDKFWPDSIMKLRNELKRIEPSLSSKGVKIIRNGRDTKTGRNVFEIRLSKGYVKTSATGQKEGPSNWAYGSAASDV